MSKRLAVALAALLLGASGCGSVHPSARHATTGPSGPTSTQHVYSTPFGPAAHSPTFGLPPASLKQRPAVQARVATLEMFDTVTISTVPSSARVVAGYTSGYWPTYLPLVRAFPRAHHVSIAIGAARRARCLDIEPGDAAPYQASGWWFSMRHQGIRRPCIYTNLAGWGAVRANLRSHGIGRGEVFEWDADWTYRRHLDAGFDGTQWTNHARGRNLDESTVTLAFAGAVPRPKPQPPVCALRCRRHRQLERDYAHRAKLRRLIRKHACHTHPRRPRACLVWRGEGARDNADIRRLHRLGVW